MKKILVLLMAIVATCAMYGQEKLYVIKVTYSVTYEYRDAYGNVLSSQSGVSGSQIFSVCAESEGEARQKAIQQCSSTCDYGGQKVGSAEIGGVRCTKYEVRRVTGASDQSKSHPNC